MKKIKQLSFVLFIFSVLAFSYPVTQVFAQGGGQCDSNPACNPASGTCCNNQCDPGPACNANDPNAIPCCSSGSNNMSSGSQPQGGHEPPMNPGNNNDYPAASILMAEKKLEKMSHELKECQSLNDELKQGLQSASEPEQTEAPRHCTQYTALNRRIDEANQKIDVMCALIYEYLSQNPGVAQLQMHGNRCTSVLWTGHPPSNQVTADICFFTKDLKQHCIEQGYDDRRLNMRAPSSKP